MIVRDIVPEYFSLTPTAYHKFAPIEYGLQKGRYLHIDLRKGDQIGYIKHKTRNLWLYDRYGKTEFLPLHIEKHKFYFAQPTVCWIKYLREPTFVIYKQSRYGVNKSQYLRYTEGNGKMKLQWVNNVNNATVFNYNFVDWKEYLAQSVDVGTEL